ncbi:MAG: hypothetical protein EOO38_14215, partial [Cytophagaceae bacterium]
MLARSHSHPKKSHESEKATAAAQGHYGEASYLPQEAMKQLLKDYWLPLSVIAALLLLASWVVLRQPVSAPPLSRAAENTVRATIGRDQHLVGADTTKAHQAAASGRTNYEAGAAYAGLGKV